MRFGTSHNNLALGFEEFKSMLLLVSFLLIVLLVSTHQVLFLSFRHGKNGKLTGTRKQPALDTP